MQSFAAASYSGVVCVHEVRSQHPQSSQHTGGGHVLWTTADLCRAHASPVPQPQSGLWRQQSACIVTSVSAASVEIPGPCDDDHNQGLSPQSPDAAEKHTTKPDATQQGTNKSSPQAVNHFVLWPPEPIVQGPSKQSTPQAIEHLHSNAATLPNQLCSSEDDNAHVAIVQLAAHVRQRSSSQQLGHLTALQQFDEQVQLMQLCTRLAKLGYRQLQGGQCPGSVSLDKLVWSCAVLHSKLLTHPQQKHQQTFHENNSQYQEQSVRTRRRRKWHADQGYSDSSQQSLEQLSQTCHHALQSLCALAASQLAAQPQTSSSSSAHMQANEGSVSGDTTSHLLQLSSRQLSMVLWGLATTGARPSPKWMALFMKASQQMLRRNSEYTCQELSNTMWAIGKLQLRLPGVYIKSLLLACQRQLQHASQQSLANTLWATARIGFQPEQGFMTQWFSAFSCQLKCSKQRQSERMAVTAAEAAVAANLLLDDMVHQPVHVSNARRSGIERASSPASRHGGMSLIPVRGLLDLDIEDLLSQHTQHTTQHHVSQALWALATLRDVKVSNAWIASVLSASQDSLRTASPQSLSNIMWALGELSHTPNTAWTAAFQTIVTAQLEHMTVQGICNVLTGLAQAKVKVSQSFATDVMQVVSKRIKEGEFSAAQLAQTLWCLSQLPVQLGTDLVEAAVQSSQRHMDDFAGHGIDVLQKFAPSKRDAFLAARKHRSVLARAASQHTNLSPGGISVRRRLFSKTEGTALPWMPSTSHQHTHASTSSAAAATGMVLDGVLPSQPSASVYTRPTPPLLSLKTVSPRTAPVLLLPRRAVAARALQASSQDGRRDVSWASAQPTKPTPASGTVSDSNAANVPTGAGVSTTAVYWRMLRLQARRAQRARSAKHATSSAANARRSQVQSEDGVDTLNLTRSQQPRRTQSGGLWNLRPLTFARLLHALAQGVRHSDAAPPGPRWRAACTYALRRALPVMDISELAQVAPALQILGVNPPMQPYRRALHRVVRDAHVQHAAQLATLVTALAESKRSGTDRWMLLCLEKLASAVQYLPGESTQQLAVALPKLYARTPQEVVQDSATTGAQTTPIRTARHASQDSGSIMPRPVHRTAPPAKHVAPAVYTCTLSQLTCLLLPRLVVCMPNLGHKELECALASIAVCPIVSSSSSSGVAKQTSPYQLFLSLLEPSLKSLDGRALAEVMTAVAGTRAGQVPPSFLAAADNAMTAALSSTSKTGFAGCEKVQMLYAYRQVGGAPSANLMQAWYASTQSQLNKLLPVQLASVLQQADEVAVATGGKLLPPRSWVEEASKTFETLPGVCSRALDRNMQQHGAVQSMDENGLPVAVHEISPEADQIIGSSTGALISCISRLHALSTATGGSTVSRSNTAVQQHVDRFVTACSMRRFPRTGLLHMMHELRSLKPSSATAPMHDHIKHLGHAIMHITVRDLFVKIWDYASTSTPAPTQATPQTITSPGAGVATSGAMTPGPSRAAVNAVTRVLELLTVMARWAVPINASWANDVIKQLSARIGCFTGAQSSMLIRTLALLQITEPIDQDVLQRLLDGCMTSVTTQCSNSQIVEIGWALGTMRISPNESWWALYEAEVQRRMHSMQMEDLCEVMWAHASLRRRPPRAWMDSYARALLPQIGSCNADQLARLIWSLAALEEVPGHAFVERYLAATEALLQVPGAFCAQSMSLMMSGLTTFRIQPRPAWAVHFTTQLCGLLPQCRGVHLAKILSSMATLNFQADEQLLRGAVAVAAARVADMDQACAAQLVWAVSKLDTSQGQHYLYSLLEKLPSSITGGSVPRRQRRVMSSTASRSRAHGHEDGDSDDDDEGVRRGSKSVSPGSSRLGSTCRTRVGVKTSKGPGRVRGRMGSEAKRSEATTSAACAPVS